MQLLIWLAFKLRLKQKFWGDMFIKHHTKQVNKFIKSLDIDVSKIKLVKSNK